MAWPFGKESQTGRVEQQNVAAWLLCLVWTCGPCGGQIRHPWLALAALAAGHWGCTPAEAWGRTRDLDTRDTRALTPRSHFPEFFLYGGFGFQQHTHTIFSSALFFLLYFFLGEVVRQRQAAPVSSGQVRGGLEGREGVAQEKERPERALMFFRLPSTDVLLFPRIAAQMVTFPKNLFCLAEQ